MVSKYKQIAFYIKNVCYVKAYEKSSIENLHIFNIFLEAMLKDDLKVLTEINQNQLIVLNVFKLFKKEMKDIYTQAINSRSQSKNG